MENTKTGFEFDLRNIATVLKKGLPFLVVLPLITMLITFYINMYHLTPVYRASTTLMVGKIYTFEDNQYIRYEDLLIANQLVKTYSQIAKSRSVCEQVIAQNNLDLTYGDFSKKVSVNAITDTQLISLNVTDADPVTASHLANETAMVFMEKVKEIIHFDNVNVIDPATVPEEPVGPKVKLNVIFAGMLGLIIAIMGIMIRRWLKQTFDNSEEAEQILEIPVLGNIPVIKSPKNKSGGI